MLAKRVIPCMDVKDGRVVKGVNFVNLRDAGDPIELAQRYDEERADEVIFLDITATSDDRATTVDLASRASEQLHLPYCVGGGFRSVADIRTMIAAGADKVSVNSAAVADPSLITSAAAAFGSQAILCAIDAKGGEVAVAGWREGAGVAAEELARDMSALGFRHLVYTDIARDGMQTGIEAAAYVRMAEAFGHPVIASGGVAGVDDIVRLGEVAGSIEGVIAGRAVYEGALSVQEGVRACDEATRRAEAAAVQANPCGM